MFSRYQKYPYVSVLGLGIALKVAFKRMSHCTNTMDGIPSRIRTLVCSAVCSAAHRIKQMLSLLAVNQSAKMEIS